MYRRLFNHLNYKKFNQITRNFLSDSYKCEDSWTARLSTPILKDVDLDSMYIELEQKFNQHGKASAIDIDIFANCAVDDHQIDEVSDLIHKLRLTNEATSVLDSTGHAIIRNFLHHNQVDQLINILDNRLSYGVFLDYFTGNILMNKLIAEQNFKQATKVSSFFMLQEEFDNPITIALSIYACFNYLKCSDNFVAEPEQVEDKKIKKEEVKVRVKFLRNEYFDDHFDLTSPKHLLGKTMLALSLKVDGSLKNTLKLVGLCLYDKYDEASAFIVELKSSESDIYQEAIDQLKLIIPEHPILSEFQSLKSLSNIEAKLNNLVSSAVKDNESKDIESQNNIYALWNDVRVKKLEEELERLKRSQTLQDIERMTMKLEDEERKLWFFENEEQLDLDIEAKKVYYPKRWFGKKKKPRAIDEGYIPPEITKHNK